MQKTEVRSQEIEAREFNLPPQFYPFCVQALHPETRAVVWETTVERPPAGELGRLYIPPLAKQLGHAITIRIMWPHGISVDNNRGMPDARD